MIISEDYMREYIETKNKQQVLNITIIFVSGLS